MLRWQVNNQSNNFLIFYKRDHQEDGMPYDASLKVVDDSFTVEIPYEFDKNDLYNDKHEA